MILYASIKIKKNIHSLNIFKASRHGEISSNQY